MVESVLMTCSNCHKDSSQWDTAYLDELYQPKYYEEIKQKNIINYFCSPYCSLLWHQGKTKNENN